MPKRSTSPGQPFDHMDIWSAWFRFDNQTKLRRELLTRIATANHAELSEIHRRLETLQPNLYTSGGKHASK